MLNYNIFQIHNLFTRLISNSSHCSTTILSKHITSALTAVKDHVIKYSETAFSNTVKYFIFVGFNFRGFLKMNWFVGL